MLEIRLISICFRPHGNMAVLRFANKFHNYLETLKDKLSRIKE